MDNFVGNLQTVDNTHLYLVDMYSALRSVVACMPMFCTIWCDIFSLCRKHWPLPGDRHFPSTSMWSSFCCLSAVTSSLSSVVVRGWVIRRDNSEGRGGGGGYWWGGVRVDLSNPSHPPLLCFHPFPPLPSSFSSPALPLSLPPYLFPLSLPFPLLPHPQGCPTEYSQIAWQEPCLPQGHSLDDSGLQCSTCSGSLLQLWATSALLHPQTLPWVAVRGHAPSSPTWKRNPWCKSIRCNVSYSRTFKKKQLSLAEKLILFGIYKLWL